jgi:hypothetical protein
VSKYRHILAIAAGIYLLLVFFERFVLVELLVRRLFVPSLLVVAEVLGIVAVGFVARRRFSFLVSRFSFAECVVSFIVGYPVFGTICFLLGLLSASRTTMVPLLTIGAIAGAMILARSTRNEKRETNNGPAVVALAVLALCAFVIAQAPPVSLDELAYHLAIPHAWVQEGRAIDLPLMSHSYFPLGIESADLPLLALLGPESGGIASHLLHLLAAIAVTLYVWRRTGSALLTAAIAATPALANTAGWSLVDWPLLGICAVLFFEEDAETTTAAVAAGMLTKYTFFPFALIVLLVQRRWRGVAPGVAIGSIFLIRNVILTGNPLAPFFSSDAPHVSGYRAGAWLSDYVFDGRFIDESLGISLLIVVLLARGRAAWVLFGAGAALFFLAPSARILVPFFAVPAMTAVLDRRALRIIVAIAVALQTLLIVFFTERSEAFSLIAGRLSEAEYVTKQRGSHASIAWLNSVLPPDSRTLVVGLGETYWFERRVRGGGNFDGERMSRYLSVVNLRERLRQDGITHVAVVNAPVPTNVASKIEERQTRLTPAAQKNLALMLDRSAANVQAHNEGTLFTLR